MRKLNIPSVCSFISILTVPYSCYSAHEHSALYSAALSSDLHIPSSTLNSLPIDISVETIISLVTIIVGLVLGTPSLRPIPWRVWAGKIERQGEYGFVNGDGKVAKDYVGNPYKLLESRPGFIDIRKQRKEFAEWVREGGGLSIAASRS